jgi:hypothetical protein
VQAGLDDSTRDQRRILFGLNTIDIEGKSIVSLLLDEVLHPFYVFQVASILLWTLDECVPRPHFHLRRVAADQLMPPPVQLLLLRLCHRAH